MIAVAVVARRRRQIVALGQRGVVHALLIVRELWSAAASRPAACSRPSAVVSAWQVAQVFATLVGKTGDFASLTRRMPCAPWQLAHVATL